MPTDSLQAARQQVLTTDTFALGYLMLCDVTYMKESSAAKSIADIEEVFSNGSVPTYVDYPGTWNLEWGPYASSDNSNLMYAASYRDQTTGDPIFVAVAIRGTDIKALGSGLWDQLKEDTGVGTQVEWPFDNPYKTNADGKAAIAKGTMEGLSILTALPGPPPGSSSVPDLPSPDTVGAFLNGFLANNPGTPLVVTGHSLGGCQTTALAAYLYTALAGLSVSIVPNSFAAPTAGNTAFATMFDSLFPYAPRWYNPYDVVPMAYANLAGIYDLWADCKHPCPWWAQDGVKKMTSIVGDLVYTQPDAVSRPIAYACADVKWYNALIDPWLSSLMYQHLPPSGYWNQVQQSYPAVGKLTGPSPAPPK